MVRLKGNTLIEVLVSLALIGLIFVIGMGLLSSFNGIYAPMEQQLTTDLAYTQLNKPVLGEDEIEIQERGRLLLRTVTIDNPITQLYKVEVIVYWKDRPIKKLQKWSFLENIE